MIASTHMDLPLLAAMGDEESFVIYVAIALGSSLIIAGALTRSALIKNWANYQNADEAHDFKFQERRFRRRTTVSWLMAIIGSMIILGVVVIFQLFPVEKSKIFAAVYWCVVLALTLWMILLALADMLASVAHVKAEMARIDGERREVENMLADYKRHKTNGEVK